MIDRYIETEINFSAISDVTPEIAKAKLADWIASVNDSELTCFNTFIKTLTKFEESICNYFINRNSSGFVEGFNNKVKVLKRRCYGLSNVARLFQCLIIDTLGMERFNPAVVGPQHGRYYLVLIKLLFHY